MGYRRNGSRAALLGAHVSIVRRRHQLCPPDAADKVLKIGFVGVTSGPAAAWGTSNVRSMQTLAAQWNEAGGVKIGDRTYDIKIVTFDDQKDPKLAIQGMEKMASEGIHYVVGPNVDDGAAAVRPVAEKNNIMYFPYAFPKTLYQAPASNAVLGMIANYQSGPAIYKYLMDHNGIKSVAFVAANESDALSQRDGGVMAAKALGLKVVASTDTYPSDTTDFAPVLTPIVKLKPDLLVLSGVAPANAPLLIRAARELGFTGLISTETAQDANVLKEGAGDLANGFISVGGASTAEIRSKAMDDFIARYTKMFGEYNDESNTKVYALQYIIDTLKANPKAIDDIAEYKKTIDGFSAPNPYVKGRRQADLCRHDFVRPEAPGVGAYGRQRVRGRCVQDAVRRRRRLTDARFDKLLPKSAERARGAGPSARADECAGMEQVIVNGLYLGAQYALIALGLTLIFALMNVLNFAHGQMYVLGGFVTYTIYGQWHLPFVVALIASSVTLAVLGALIEKFLFRTVIRRSKREESTMLLAAAIAFLFDAVILLVFGEKGHGVPKILNGVLNTGSIIVPYDRILVFGLAVVFIAVFMAFMQFSKTGRAMRALAQDRVAAQLMGVNVDRYSMIGFAVGAMLAGLVGGLLVTITGVSSGIGGAISTKAFMMVMIGGAGVVGGAIAGGFILGMLEAVGLTVLHAYGDITYLVIFATLMVFLAIRPNGLMGKPWG